ncbi:peptidase M4 family protein [Chloroflexi bacterium CFX2]|nr:peptidase M4 family protein [Chloroflexi bacterium CFX2]
MAEKGEPMHAHRSILCITPPHMLREIARNGTPTQREVAQRTLTASESLRAKRSAIGGRIAASLAGAIVGGKERTIFDAKNGSNLPGIKVRGEGDPASPDPAVNEAYDGSGITYDLFLNAFGRNSIDNNGLKLNSTVHYQKGYDNAFWDGEQMVYGDGDEDLPPAERLFNRFTKALDVIGHELTHGVTQYEANLNYYAQPGALNESMSDVFGSLVKQYQRMQTADQADWIIGEGLFTENVKGVGIRSMKAPGTAYDDPVLGKDPQPAHMKDYVNTIEDNGGVHINSGIPNHAFYIAARELGGYAWEKAGAIWYKALADKLHAASSFADAANLTVQAAAELFGSGSLEEQAVKTGWAQVGISVGAPPANEGCFTSVLRALGLVK